METFVYVILAILIAIVITIVIAIIIRLICFFCCKCSDSDSTSGKYETQRRPSAYESRLQSIKVENKRKPSTSPPPRRPRYAKIRLAKTDNNEISFADLLELRMDLSCSRDTTKCLGWECINTFLKVF